ncbi:MAG TPA: hypothetical protein VJB92_01640 [Candidatus Paceibacterota bacterium]
MLIITKKQALERWDTLPQNLKEAIFSPANADIIWKFCENNHVTEEKIRVIATVGGDVLMGFLHPDPEDVAREIEERAKIPKPLALDIARELERKIFLPLKSDLDRIYAPPAQTEKQPLPLRETLLETKLAPVFVPQASTIVKIKPQETPIAARETPIPPDGDQPFLLHEEKPAFSPETPREKPFVSFEAKRDFQKPPLPKPVNVKIETPEKEENESDENSGSARVVHYSNLRTPLDDNK